MALSKTIRAHSVPLAVFLLVTGFINFWAIFMYGLRFAARNSPDKIARHEQEAAWAIIAFILLSIANVVFVWLIFKWKRWGLMGYVAAHIVAFAIDLIAGARFGQAVPNLIWPLVMIFLISFEWNDTEW